MRGRTTRAEVSGTSRGRSARLAVAGAALWLSLPGAVGAQTPDYPGPPPPAVLGESQERTIPPQVLGESAERDLPAAPGGGAGLPVTGGDVVGLAALGLGAIATGTVLVRRTRTRPA